MYLPDDFPQPGYGRARRGFFLPISPAATRRPTDRFGVFYRVLLALGLLISFRSTAQTDTLYLDLNRDLGEQLLPFEELYQLALKVSPTLKEETAQAEGKAYAVSLAKIDVLQTLSLTANYAMGNQALVSNGTTSFETLQLSNGYRGGISLTLPIYALVGRKARIRQAEAGYRSTLARTETVKLALRRDLYKLYQEILTAQRVLKILILEEQNFLVRQRKSELEWQNGRATFEEYAGVNTLYTDVRVKVENARGSFLSLLFELTVLTGRDIAQLKR
jgi:outer membrane protein TolC